MFEFNQRYATLGVALNSHRQLLKRFELFANFVAEWSSEEKYIIESIELSLNINQCFFSTKSAGRTLEFRFNSILKEDGSMVGKVTCYMKKEFPEIKYVPIGNFELTNDSKKSIVEVGNEKLVFTEDSLLAFHIVRNYIYESLSY